MHGAIKKKLCISQTRDTKSFEKNKSKMVLYLNFIASYRKYYFIILFFCPYNLNWKTWMHKHYVTAAILDQTLETNPTQLNWKVDTHSQNKRRHPLPPSSFSQQGESGFKKRTIISV